MVVAGILALIGFVLDPSRNRWLLGAIFVIGANVAADFSVALTLDLDEIREGVWLGFTGGVVSALASALAFALSQFEFRGVRAENQFD
jgi:urea transporter